MTYHYGLIIRKYRTLSGRTQADLAENWKDDGGVLTRYVQDVERGTKRVTDTSTLRHIARYLNIPLWEFGLSEYNPFTGQFETSGETTIVDSSLNLAQELIKTTWHARFNTSLSVAEKAIETLLAHFEHIKRYYPAQADTSRFLSLLAQVQRLVAVIAVERREYTKALETYKSMLAIAQSSSSPVAIAHAYIGIGREYERGYQFPEAVEMLEEARDISFQTNKRLAALANMFLARGYASTSNTKRYERAIETALILASYLEDDTQSTEDFIFYGPSAIIEEKILNLIKLEKPTLALQLRPTIEQQIDKENFTFLKNYVPLYWAQSYLQLNDIEESIHQIREFFTRSTSMQSPEVLARVYIHLRDIEKAGHKELPVVKQFQEEMDAYSKQLEEAMKIAMREDTEHR